MQGPSPRSRFEIDGDPDTGFGEVSLSEIDEFGLTLIGEAGGVLAAGTAYSVAARPPRGVLGLLTRLLDDASRDPSSCRRLLLTVALAGRSRPG